jgi:methyl-accepting chemotaxis protein
MDKVTQQNAANAEESASASEEMNAQAEQMKGNVDDLVTLVDGDRKNGGLRHNGEIGRRKTPGARAGTGTRMALTAPPKVAKGKEVAVRGTKEVKPDQVIPMGKSDFKDF